MQLWTTFYCNVPRIPNMLNMKENELHVYINTLNNDFQIAGCRLITFIGSMQMCIKKGRIPLNCL